MTATVRVRPSVLFVQEAERRWTLLGATATTVGYYCACSGQICCAVSYRVWESGSYILLHSFQYIRFHTFGSLHSIQYIQFHTFSSMYWIPYIHFHTFGSIPPPPRITATALEPERVLGNIKGETYGERQVRTQFVAIHCRTFTVPACGSQ